MELSLLARFFLNYLSDLVTEVKAIVKLLEFIQELSLCLFTGEADDFHVLVVFDDCQLESRLDDLLNFMEVDCEDTFL